MIHCQYCYCVIEKDEKRFHPYNDGECPVCKEFFDGVNKIDKLNAHIWGKAEEEMNNKFSPVNESHLGLIRYLWPFPNNICIVAKIRDYIYEKDSQLP